MFAASPANRNSSGSNGGGTAASEPAPAMTNEELLAHQLDLHQKIQQQMQLQMEMSLQLGARQSLAASMASRPSLTASLSRVEPDLGDNVFDMLDDLIMIPSGAASSDARASLSKQVESDGDDEGSGGGAGGVGAGVGSGSISGGRDSLADILESLDMDLEDFGDENKLIDTSHLMNATYNDEERDSFDDDLDDLDLDLDLDLDDHGVDDDDDGDDNNNSITDDIDVSDPNEHAVEEDFVHMRRSSLDMLASVSGSVSSVSQSTTGNMCTLVWEGGLLGLRLRMSQSRMMPAVSKITGKSSIVGIHLVEVGDLLLQIGDRITRDMEFIDAINYLKEAPKPCKLVFRRLTSDPMVVKPVQPQVSSALALKLANKFEELTQADNDKSPAPPAVKLDEKYEIKWLDGPLGISLIASKDVAYPLVTRITGKNRSPQVQDVQPGHYLVQIGNYNTADGNFNTAIKFLQKVTKPVSLYFCPGNKKMSVRPEPADDEYDHVWEKKQALSFTVKPDAHGRMVVADVGSAKSIKVKAKGVPNIASFISSGDLIMWINDDATNDLTFHEALLKLRTAKRPLVIRFKKAPLEPPAESRTPVPASSPKAELLTTSDLSPSLPSPAHKAASTSTVPPPPPPPQTQPPPQPKPVAPAPRSFNPLKKIAALGAYAKENSMNSGNGKNGSTDGKKVSPDAAQTKKHTLFGGGGDSDHHSKKYQEAATAAAAAAAAATATASSSNGGRAPKLTPPGSANGNNARSPTSADYHHQHHQKHAGPSDNRHNNNADTHARIMNLDTLSSQQQHRKAALLKSSSDPAVPAANGNDPAASLRPLPRSAKNLPSAGPPLDDSGRHPSPSSSRSSEKDTDVYEVVWPEGTALGLTLRVHPTTRFPVVARVTGTSNLKNIEHVQPGDILFAANNMNIVPQPKFKQTLENLSRLPKPAVLRFRRAHPTGFGPSGSGGSGGARVEETDYALPRGPPLKDSEYELIWRENANLGLVFSSDNDVPKVTKVDLESGGPMLQKVAVGDTLSWIGPMDIHGSSFHQSMATLRAIKRPVVLRFHKRQHR